MRLNLNKRIFNQKQNRQLGTAGGGIGIYKLTHNVEQFFKNA